MTNKKKDFLSSLGNDKKITKQNKSSARKKVVMGTTMFLVAGAGAGITAGAMALLNREPIDIKILMIPAYNSELAISAATRLEKYVNSRNYMPKIQIQTVTGGKIDVVRAIKNGSHDVALTTHSSWLQNVRDDGDEEVQLLLQSQRPGLLWDKPTEDGMRPALAFGDVTLEEEYANPPNIDEIKQITIASNGKDEQWKEGQWNEKDEVNGSTWFRSQLFKSKKGLGLWMAHDGVKDGSSVSLTFIGWNYSTDSMEEMTIDSGAKLSIYLSSLFADAHDLASTENNVGRIDVTALTNLVDARRDINDEVASERWLNPYSVVVNNSNYGGPSQMYRDLFKYEQGVTFEDVWIDLDKDKSGNSDYIVKSPGAKGSLNNFFEGVTLLAGNFSGWRQQEENVWQDAADDAYSDGEVLSVSAPIWNGGWIIRRDIDEAMKLFIGNLLRQLISMEKFQNEDELFGLYSHQNYIFVDDRIWLDK